MQENEFDNPTDEIAENQSGDVEESIKEDEKENFTEGNADGDNEAVTKLQKELDEQKDKYIRLFAEFDNYKRRTSKEAIELRQTAGKEIIVSLLDVLDDMDRAEKQLQESEADKILKEGILLVFDKFKKTMHSKGLKAINTYHTEFDVEKDEAVSEIEVPDKKLKGKVVAELQKGYLLNDKVIRFAKVVVGK
jgi:molecular chaperone GrpE